MTFIRAPKVRAVAFDLDGTLIDSMGHHADAWEKTLSEIGYRFNRELFLRSEGIPLRTLIPIVVDRPLDDKNSVDDLILAKDREYRKIHQKASLVDGARELIVFLQCLGVPVGLVTAGQRNRVTTTLNTADFDLFDAVICGDDSAHGKPLPHPYLAVAERFDVAPRNLLVIENAVCGAVSSYLADAQLIYVGSEKLDLPNQIARCDSMRDIKKLLGKSELVCAQSLSQGS